jgi:glycosyltransferase involved in cell wall biosynthesis
MKSILHVIDTGGPGGAETVFAEIAVGLRERGYRSSAIVSREGWLAERLRTDRLNPHIVNGAGAFNLAYLRRLRALARAEEADVVIAHLLGSIVYCGLMTLGTRARLLGVFHGQADLSATDSMRWLKAQVVERRCQRVVAVSNGLKEEIGERLRLRAAQLTTVYNGIDVQAFAPQPDRSLRQALEIPDDAILIGALGNIRRAKGYEVLLGAAAKLRTSGQDFRFVIVGEPDKAGVLMRELEEMRASLGLIDSVSLLGFRSDTARILNNLDIFVLPSWTEGFSLACVEAMACGIPVVATRSGGPVELLEPDRAGILIEPGDLDSLA